MKRRHNSSPSKYLIPEHLQCWPLVSWRLLVSDSSEYVRRKQKALEAGTGEKVAWEEREEG